MNKNTKLSYNFIMTNIIMVLIIMYFILHCFISDKGYIKMLVLKNAIVKKKHYY